MVSWVFYALSRHEGAVNRHEGGWIDVRANRRCVLHVGTTKAGSSSIQESLYFGLRDPGYQYISLGCVNSGRVLGTLFRKAPEDFDYNRRFGRDSDSVHREREEFAERLRRQLLFCRERGKTIVLSAENMWVWDRSELESVREFFGSFGYSVEVYLYFRPWKSWIESDFQEGIKLGNRLQEFIPESRLKHLNYLGQLKELQGVFGESCVFPKAFLPATWLDRCVVRDFCERARIPISPNRIVRVNEGLCLDALRLLAAFRKYHSGYEPGIRSVVHNEILCRTLGDVPGPRVAFHSGLVADLEQVWEVQREELEGILGESLTEDLQRYDNGACLRGPGDLFEFSTESLRWLEHHTKLGPIPEGGDSERIRAVGERMHGLCYHPSLGARYGFHAMLMKRRLAHGLRGV